MHCESSTMFLKCICEKDSSVEHVTKQVILEQDRKHLSMSQYKSASKIVSPTYGKN